MYTCNIFQQFTEYTIIGLVESVLALFGTNVSDIDKTLKSLEWGIVEF